MEEERRDPSDLVSELSVSEIPSISTDIGPDAQNARALQGTDYKDQPYNAEQAENDIRRFFVIGVLVIVALTVLAALVVAVFHPENWASMKDLLLILLPLETAALGAMASFYFGARIVRP